VEEEEEERRRIGRSRLVVVSSGKLRLRRMCRWTDSMEWLGLGDLLGLGRGLCVVWPAVGRWSVASQSLSTWDCSLRLLVACPKRSLLVDGEIASQEKAAVLRLPVAGTGRRPVKVQAIRTVDTVREPSPSLTLDKPAVSPGRGRRTLAERAPPEPTPPRVCNPPHPSHSHHTFFTLEHSSPSHHPPPSSGADVAVPVPPQCPRQPTTAAGTRRRSAHWMQLLDPLAPLFPAIKCQTTHGRLISKPKADRREA
jgi:hypothetical protein